MAVGGGGRRIDSGWGAVVGDVLVSLEVGVVLVAGVATVAIGCPSEATTLSVVLSLDEETVPHPAIASVASRNTAGRMRERPLVPRVSLAPAGGSA